MIDIQSQTDKRNISINKVGIKELLYPISIFKEKEYLQSTNAKINLYVSLEKKEKGTHMSRFIEILNQYHKKIEIYNPSKMLNTLKTKLNSKNAYIEMSFQYFIEKKSPIKNLKGLMNYKCKTYCSINDKNQISKTLEVNVKVKTLCPCSKAISTQGAHNQRSNVKVTINSNKTILIEEIIKIIENSSSSELYSLLKREDEKYVTEKAYDNPYFVEDIVREVTLKLKENKNIISFKVESENFESIHNHNAYAYINSKT